jgi:hypothetical protein
MKTEDQVCSLELAKKIKELGGGQWEPFAFWYVADNGSEAKLITRDRWIPVIKAEVFPAFTIAELGEMLPPAFSSSRGADNRWMCVNEMKSNSEDGRIRFADTEADARAKMLIYLFENRHIHA